MCTEPWTENLSGVWMVCANARKHTHKCKRGKELRGRSASCVSHRDTRYAALVGGMMDGWLAVCICTALFSKVLNAILLLRLSKPAAIFPPRAPPPQPDHTTTTPPLFNCQAYFWAAHRRLEGAAGRRREETWPWCFGVFFYAGVKFDIDDFNGKHGALVSFGWLNNIKLCLLKLLQQNYEILASETLDVFS